MSRTATNKTITTSVRFGCTAPDCVRGLTLSIPANVQETTPATAMAWAIARAENSGWEVSTVNAETCDLHTE